MARKSSGGWRLQSAFWGMVGDRFSLSDLVLLFLYVRRSVAVSSPGFRRFAALAQAVLGYGGCLSSVFEPEYPPPSVVCAGGFLYHGGEFVSFSTQAGWCLSSVAGSRRSYGSDGPSVSNFSSSVLGDDERVVVLWSLTATS
ncbi:unnamed protein product [Brassica rapa subsp. trilocularis]